MRAMQKMMELSGEVLLDQSSSVIPEDTFVMQAQKNVPGWANRQKVVVAESFAEEPRRCVKWDLPAAAGPPQPRVRRGSAGAAAPFPKVWRGPEQEPAPRLLDKEVIEENVEETKREKEEWEKVAMSVKEALAMTEAEDDCFGDDAPVFVPENKVNFPVVSSEESLSYRIESIRAFLEKEIGVDKLIALHEELKSKGEDDKLAGSVINGIDPGIVLIAQQLLILDGDLDGPDVKSI
jgi:hypothetical protein